MPPRPPLNGSFCSLIFPSPSLPFLIIALGSQPFNKLSLLRRQEVQRPRAWSPEPNARAGTLALLPTHLSMPRFPWDMGQWQCLSAARTKETPGVSWSYVWEETQ